MSAWIWLIGGGFALGVCILAMHFVGMLVMDHAINIRFDPFLTGFSMPIALDSPFLRYGWSALKNCAFAVYCRACW
ncbi:hypothetical protein LFZ51_13740 [Salmonella enterica subsp. arizonae serovar 63:g,z51:- str. So 20/20]|nr:hypothetical protein LFZ51_13740 [Salmonella enterica subsp. arizonae serovar 63:g,z51:- str. So 20/20]